MPSSKKEHKPKAAKKPITQATIDELIRKFKGKNAVECDCLKSSLSTKYSRYQFVGLSGGVLYLNFEKMTGRLLPADSMTAKKWRAQQSRITKLAEGKLAKEAK
jgi:hypothetical protein